ncbi:MAG TPA: bifunctional DNA-binding transcriptional regulator/O6-methylguanine-DNA methyltransferase Ada [Thermomicrobiales bacterium]|nr:bifunctional DNA-binding transcriptional regulator/O6-methylguanine-DNA methyltransferase Ada [Thermomicrobiales bacterium]
MLTRTPSTTTLDEERWRAVVNRDRAYEGKFVLAVHTTGIFCRPGCPARTPKRENISFFDTTADALRAGFRPCKRCRPLGTSISEDHARMVESAIRAMEQSESRLTLEALAAHVGMSPWHFQRIFRQQTGLTPAQYQRSLRSSRIRDELQAAPTVTEAMNNAGYGSSSQFYAATEGELGMRPSSYRAGGKGERIRYGIVQTWLGSLLVAGTDRGVCSLQMGDSEEEMLERLHETFPNAELIADDPDFARIVADVVSLAEQPSTPSSIPVDAKGTAFQHRVWNALRRIPAGTTWTYSELAEQIGSPRSVRAVAKACADNPVPLLVPCHRVIGKNGSLTGYRYGVERKRDLLDRERDPVTT